MLGLERCQKNIVSTSKMEKLFFFGGYCRGFLGQILEVMGWTALPMGHAQKRFVSTAAKLASVSTANLGKFPPKEALFVHREIPKAPFSPETWASLQPPPSSALSAFAHRIGLASVLTSVDIIQQACTHPSFLILHRQQYPHQPQPATNAQLAPIGNALMGLFASEYIHASYPYLPTRVLKAAVTAHVGPLTCASVAQEMGAAPLLRWHRTVRCMD
jgi:large subunit ribosomal protein L44